MALSSSSVLRRLLLSRGGPSPSSLLQWNIPFFSSRRLSSSFPFDDNPTESANLPPLSMTKLFVSVLSRLTTDEKLKEAFTPFGHLLEAKVITDRISGRSKGFGFVTYATIEEAEKAWKE